MKVLLIGGVAGGATAAARLRRLDEEAEIIILERSGYVSYANCGLPYYIGGDITDREELTLQTPQSFWDRYRIEVRTEHEAIRIDPVSKQVYVRNLKENTEYTESYDKLILSPGAKPVVPQIPGLERDRVFTLRTVEDTFRIYNEIQSLCPKKAAVIGGGFIGLEMAENLVHRGIEVTLFQRSDQVMPPLDQDMAAMVHNYMRGKGIDLRLHADVIGVQTEDGCTKIELKTGETVETDLIILAVGVLPETGLAKDAGLELGVKEAICTNQYMQTSEPDIYAVGDAVEVRHFVTGKKAVIALAGPANKQGRIAANHICGVSSEFHGSQGSSVMKLFDMTVAATGINEKEAAFAGLNFDYVVLSGASHATYYPNAANIVSKILFEKTSGRLLGGQIIGFGGVDKRIDVLATAIRGGMTAYDLTELDLAYAPPYSSAKDPINMAGYVMENLLEDKMKQVHWKDIVALPEDAVLLDVRTDEEYFAGHVEGTRHIPLDSLRERLAELPKDKTLYVYCQSGMRSYLGCRILKKNGFHCYNVAGGYGFYESIKKDGQLAEQGAGPCGLHK